MQVDEQPNVLFPGLELTVVSQILSWGWLYSLHLSYHAIHGVSFVCPVETQTHFLVCGQICYWQQRLIANECPIALCVRTVQQSVIY